MHTIQTIDLTTATLPALRSALAEVGAYNGVARYSAADMRAYAAKVAQLFAGGWDAQCSAATIDALVSMFNAEQERLAAEAAAAAVVEPASAVETTPVEDEAPAVPGRVMPGRHSHAVVVTLTEQHVVDIVALWPSLQGSPALVPGAVVALRRTASLEAAAAFAKSADCRRFDPWCPDADKVAAEVPADGFALMPRAKGATKTALVAARRAANVASKG